MNELARDSRSSPVDINKTDTLVVAANHDTDSVSILSTATNTVSAKVTGLPSPVAVAFAPNGTTFYVLHHDGLTRVTAADTISPTAAAPVPVCAEPKGLALSPSGNRAYVACLEGSVVLVDLSGATPTVTSTVNLRGATAGSATLPANAAAWSIAVTNDQDGSDTDEKVVLPLFYYDKVDVASRNDVDLGGVGVVAYLNADGTVSGRTEIMPEADTGFGTGVGAFMNQLSAVWVQNGKAYVLALAASPKGAPGPADATGGAVPGSRNTMPFLIVLDITTQAVLARHNINGLVQAKVTGASAFPIRFASVPSSLAFVPGTDIGYLTSVASDAIFRIRLNADGTLNTGEAVSGGFGSNRNNFIALDKAPTGITISHGTGAIGARAYVINEVSRSIQAVDFAMQATSATVVSEPQPAAGSDEEKVLKGKRFFITSTGRWGNNGMVGCLACHPGNGALSDNVTWYFAAGPRQTVSMDAMFGRLGETVGAAKDPANQRALNWSAIFDEMHDFEGNTRTVSAGVGAIVSATALDNASRINMATAGPAGASASNLRNSSKVVVTNTSVLKDWDEIDEYFLHVDTPRAPAGDTAAVGRGRTLFGTAQCATCHGGSKWTVSRVPYDPTNATGGPLASERARTVTYTATPPFNTDTTVIATDDVPDAELGAANKIDRLACVVRSVGTHTVSDPFEVRANMTTPSHGRKGFNPPSLLGIRYGAPYLHNGKVRTLTELFTDTAWEQHATSGNPNFLANANTRAAEVADLVAFLESIDADTAPFPIPQGSVLCPAVP